MEIDFFRPKGDVVFKRFWKSYSWHKVEGAFTKVWFVCIELLMKDRELWWNRNDNIPKGYEHIGSDTYLFVADTNYASKLWQQPEAGDVI